ncbi:hypothetical protein FRC11_006202, partial [Ceratobasidium sp. 423]
MLTNPEIPRTPGQAWQLLATHNLVDSEEVDLDVNMLVKILSDTLRHEDIPHVAAAIGEGALVLLLGALKGVSDVSGALAALSDKVDNLVGFAQSVESVVLETQGEVRAYCEHSSMQAEDMLACLSAAAATQPPAGTPVTPATPPTHLVTQPTVQDLKEVDARADLCTRRVLVEPGVNTDSLKELTLEALQAKFELAIDKAPASWLCAPDAAPPFAAALGDISFRGQEAQVLVEKLPIHLDIPAPATLHEIELKNGLGTDTLLKVEWIKPPHHHDPGQQFAHAKFTLCSNDMADRLIGQQCFIWHQICNVCHLAKEPSHCSKCQCFGHKRAKCKPDQKQ